MIKLETMTSSGSQGWDDFGQDHQYQKPPHQPYMQQ
jgi:hypothetical protein